MHDIKYIRNTPDVFAALMKRRGHTGVLEQILTLDTQRREKITQAQQAQEAHKTLSKDAGAARKAGDLDVFEKLRNEISANKDALATLQAEAKTADETLIALLESLPNTPYDDVPDGKDEQDNVEVQRWGTPTAFAFTPEEHFAIPGAMPHLDFETAGTLSGSRFALLKGPIARLHRALAQYMLDTHINAHDLEEVQTPVLVRDSALYGTGQLPKFADDCYKTTEGMWLIPTSEVTLTNMVANTDLNADTLPLRYTAHTLCFRSEAGAAGKDTKGMLRQHQFEKVEMVSITHPDQSEHEHARMVNCARAILEGLNLPYRTLKLCVGDMGFGAKRTLDLEVWLPGQNAYREISSVSTCGDFQARRMNARFRDSDGTLKFVHTLNGSGVAVGRCLIAVLENNQDKNGGIKIPEVLSTRMGGKTYITPNGELV